MEVAEKEQMERETGTMMRPGLNIGGREGTDGERDRDNEARA